MAYQDVGRPRFWVSILQFLKANGQLELSYVDENGNAADLSHFSTDISQLFDVNPASHTNFQAPAGLAEIRCSSLTGDYSTLMPNEGNFWMILNHDLAGVNCYSKSVVENNHVANSPILNFDFYSPISPGWSLGAANNAHDIYDNRLGIYLSNYYNNVKYRIGCFLYGTVYNMPHSPDLKLSLSYEYDGVKEITTKGGASLSNSYYHRQPSWGDLAAWEIGDHPEGKNTGFSGRRVWSLSFSYLDNGDVFGSNQHYGKTDWGYFSANDFDDNDITSSGNYEFNLLTDVNFYSQVINKTNGGQLPFVFQPDGNDYTNMAICKLDQGSIKFDQVANGVYNCSLKLREVW